MSDDTREDHTSGGSEGDVTTDTSGGPADAPDKEISDTPKTPRTERTTAPQSPYSNRSVGVGFVVALIGVAIVFGIPLLLA